MQAEQLAQLRDPANWPQAKLRASLTGALERLKADYIQLYLDLHRRARLTPDEDERQKRLLADPRHKQLTALADLDFLPVASLQRWQEKLAELRPCFALGATDLKDRPLCPHCQYRPVAEEEPGQPAGTLLDRREDELDNLHAAWTAALLTTLGQETPRQTIELMAPTRQKLIGDFTTARTLPEKVSYDFIQAVKEALGGLSKVSIPPEDILMALTEGGTSCTVQEIQTRFGKFIKELTKGQDPNKVRIVIEW